MIIKKKIDRVEIFIDASFAPHVDFKSHSGVLIAIGWNVIGIKSRIHKVNATNSTEIELVTLTYYVQETKDMTEFLRATVIQDEL